MSDMFESENSTYSKPDGNVLKAVPVWSTRTEDLFARASVPCMNAMWNTTVDMTFSKMKNNLFYNTEILNIYVEMKATAVWSRMYQGDYASERILNLCKLFESTQLRGRIDNSCAYEWGLMKLYESETAKDLAQETIRNYVSCWQTLMHHRNVTKQGLGVYICPEKHTADEIVSFLEHHCMHYCTNRNDWTPLTKKTFAFNALSTCKHIGYVLPEFYMYCKKHSMAVRADKAYSRKSNEELEKELMCTDQTLLTTAKIQSEVVTFNAGHRHHLTQTIPKLYFSARCVETHFFNVLMGLFSFLGNRPQDFLAELATNEQVLTATEGAFYIAEAHQFVWKDYGKTKKTYKERKSVVPPILAEALELYHHVFEVATGIKPKTLLPTLNAKDRAVDDMRKQVFKALEHNGFPKVSPTTLRHLYETHLVYFMCVVPDMYKQLMDGIGHSVATSHEFYSQKYRGLITHPLGYDCKEAHANAFEPIQEGELELLGDDEGNDADDEGVNQTEQ